MSGSIIQLDFRVAIQADPNIARCEDAFYLDANGLLVKHQRVSFPISSSVSNPELIWEFILPTTYGGATGFTCVFFYATEVPIIAGNIVWGFSAQRARTANASDLINSSDSWGTEVTTTDTVPSVAGEYKKVSLALVKANVGGAGTPVAGEMCRFRLRRVNTNAADTLVSSAYLIGSADLQDT